MIFQIPKSKSSVPRSLPKPRLKRLPKRKVPMTLVAAFRCPKGGIMLLADREENDGYNRREVDKIYRINLIPCQVFIAGAGPSGIVVNANSHIHTALAKALSEGKDILVEHKNIIETALKELHKQYASNLKSGYLDLLIVIAPLGEEYSPILYRTEQSMLIPEYYYAAYGSGRGMCDYFADRLYQHGRLDKDSMKVMAAFILREVEHSVSGVGMGADMRFIHEGEKTIGYIFSGVIREIQALIPSIQESLWADWKARVAIPQHYSG